MKGSWSLMWTHNYTLLVNPFGAIAIYLYPKIHHTNGDDSLKILSCQLIDDIHPATLTRVDAGYVPGVVATDSMV